MPTYAATNPEKAYNIVWICSADDFSALEEAKKILGESARIIRMEDNDTAEFMKENHIKKEDE